VMKAPHKARVKPPAEKTMRPAMETPVVTAAAEMTSAV